MGVWIVLIAEPLQAQMIVSSISVRGNRAFESGQLLDRFSTKAGLPFSRDIFQKDLQSLLAGYHQSGYFFAAIDSTRFSVSDDSASADIVVFFSEGERAIVRSLGMQGNTFVTRDVLVDQMETSPGSEFIPSVLESDLRRILKFYETGGYPFAKASVENIRMGEDGVGIELLIREGSAVRVSEIKVEGNKTTKDAVIIREVRLSEDQVYSDQLGDRVRRRLERLQLFSSVSVPQFYLSEEGKGGLIIEVTEGNPNRFDGVLGYIPATGQGEKGFLTGLIDVQLRNLFGTGRKLSTRWYRENQASQELAIRYSEPWVASLPLNATVGFFQRKQDSTFIRQSFDASVAIMITEELSAGLSVEQRNIFPTDRPGNPVGESRALDVGLSVFFDSRDDPIVPTSGVVYRTTYELGTKTRERSTQGPSKDGTGRLTFDMEYFVSPWSRQVVAAGVHIRDFQSALVEQSDLFHLGGATTLRGYRESQFFGSRIVWMSLEYRFLTGGRSALYGFLDGGYIVVPENPSAGLVKSEQTKVGYGIGARLDTSLGLVGISLALGENDTMRTGKLHLRLVNEF